MMLNSRPVNAIPARRAKMQTWQILVFATLFINVTEGAIRKWFLPGSSQLVYFAKDAVLILAYASFFFGGHHKNNSRTKTLTILLLSAGIIIFLDAFNPNVGSVIVGIFGIKCYILYA